MANKFKFNIITGSTAQTKYDAITTKEPYTFYLLENGVGYLGSTKLFDAADAGNSAVITAGTYFNNVEFHTIAQSELDNHTFANYASFDSSVVAGSKGLKITSVDVTAPTDATKNKYYFVNLPYAKGEFCNYISTHTITAAEISSNKIGPTNAIIASGTVAGDEGLILGFGNSGSNGAGGTISVCYFIPLKTSTALTGKFFRAVEAYTVTQADIDGTDISTPSGTVAGDKGFLFTADNDETTDGDEKKYFVPIKVDVPATVTSFTNSDTTGTNASKVPTVAAVVDYIANALADKVSFEIDGVAGAATSDGSMAFPGVFSETETRIGTWIDGSPVYRRVIHVTQTLTKDTYLNISVPNVKIPINLDLICYRAIDSCEVINAGSNYGNTGITLKYSNITHTVDIKPTESWFTTGSNTGLDPYIVIEYTKTTDSVS